MNEEENIANIGIVLVEYEMEIADLLLRSAENELKSLGVVLNCVLRTKSSLQTPFLTSLLMEQQNIDAVIILGCILKGESSHASAKFSAVVTTLLLLSAQNKKPIGVAIIGPDLTKEQALIRVNQYVKEAISSCCDSRTQFGKFSFQRFSRR